MTLKERFHSKYKKKKNGCWDWVASLTNSGYGRIREAGGKSKTLLAHRVSWELSGEKIKNGFLVLHKCDNRKCVNPAHLFLGTYADNAQDRQNKGKGRKQNGEQNSSSKLTNKLVLKIRKMRDDGSRYAEISREFHIPRSTIFNVCNVTWKHI